MTGSSMATGCDMTRSDHMRMNNRKLRHIRPIGAYSLGRVRCAHAQPEVAWLSDVTLQEVTESHMTGNDVIKYHVTP
jgi:hypothetical protein